MSMVPIISIFNNKGGVGKTTTTCNLAHALAKKSYKVLVIDNDTQSDSSEILLLSDFIKNAKTLHDVLSKKTEIKQCIIQSKFKNVFCLPNDEGTSILEPKLMENYKENLSLFKKLIYPYAKSNFDYVLIDNSPSFGIYPLMSLSMSDFVLVPNEAGSKKSLKGIVNAVDFIRDIKEQGNPKLKFLKILLTKVDKRTNISKALVEYIEKTFEKDMLFNTKIPTNTHVQQAEASNTTVVKFRPSAPASIAYKNLADEIISSI